VVARPDAAAAEPQAICLDKGYDYPQVDELVDEFGLSAHIRSRGEQKHALEREAGLHARR
jgi:putative transposase